MKTQQLRTSPRYITVPAEIPIYLPCECVGSHEDGNEVPTDMPVKNSVGQRGAVVSNNRLAKESGNNEHAAIEKCPIIESPRSLYLGQEMRWSLDGPGNQVRK